MKRLAMWATLACCCVQAADENQVVAVSLEPAKMHEECMRLEAGDKRAYHWKSTAPVDFNVHYHRGDQVLFPVKRDGMRGDGGTFVAKTGEDYCWMWTARDKPAKVEASITRP